MVAHFEKVYHRRLQELCQHVLEESDVCSDLSILRRLPDLNEKKITMKLTRARFWQICSILVMFTLGLVALQLHFKIEGNKGRHRKLAAFQQLAHKMVADNGFLGLSVHDVVKLFGEPYTTS